LQLFADEVDDDEDFAGGEEDLVSAIRDLKTQVDEDDAEDDEYEDESDEEYEDEEEYEESEDEEFEDEDEYEDDEETDEDEDDEKTNLKFNRKRTTLSSLLNVDSKN
jgi:hypothetical protein